MQVMDAVRKLTGTTGGESPVFDGTMRGALVAILNGALGFAGVSGWLDATQTAALLVIVNPLVFFAFGVWDKIMAPRLLARITFSGVGDQGSEQVVPLSKVTIKTETGTVSGRDVSNALKAARLPQDKRIVKKPFRMKTTQARGADGRFGPKKKR